VGKGVRGFLPEKLLNFYVAVGEFGRISDHYTDLTTLHFSAEGLKFLRYNSLNGLDRTSQLEVIFSAFWQVKIIVECCVLRAKI
jgi:hypothetical protein